MEEIQAAEVEDEKKELILSCLDIHLGFNMNWASFHVVELTSTLHFSACTLCVLKITTRIVCLFIYS